MSIRVAINGFGRMGRLALRVAWDSPTIDVVHINEPAGDANAAAHLVEYDSVHGRWDKTISSSTSGNEQHIIIDGQSVSYSQNTAIEKTAWNDKKVDLVIECSGKFKTSEALAPYFTAGIKKVVVSAPIKTTPSSTDIINIVMGVNHSSSTTLLQQPLVPLTVLLLSLMSFIAPLVLSTGLSLRFTISLTPKAFLMNTIKIYVALALVALP